MIQSPLLTPFDFVHHAFGSRSDSPFVGVLSQQVHGNKVLFLDRPPVSPLSGYDALVTDQKGIAIGVTTADCLPILLVEPERRIVGVVHAGWRGTLARVVQKTVEEIARRGGRPASLRAALGPAIQQRCYEVGEEVANPFQKEFAVLGAELKPSRQGKWRCDLPEINRAQLLEAGLRPETIDRIDLCTHCRPDLFYSYRRDGSGTGKMISQIQIL